jgi:hypothetical protein
MLSRRALIRLAGILLLALPCGGSFAEEPMTEGPAANAADPSKIDEPPSGGCLPIGVTASGEIVFPFICKGFLERNKGLAAAPPTDEQRPLSEKPASVAQPSEQQGQIATKQPEESAPETAEPAQMPIDTVSSITPPSTSSTRPTKKKKLVTNSRDCTHYRTFDPNSKTYRDYKGRRQICRF